MITYDKMDKEELEIELKKEQDYLAFMVAEQPGEAYIITMTQERIDKLQRIIKSFANVD